MERLDNVSPTFSDSSFNDIFRLMSWIFLGALILVPFCRLPVGPAPAPSESSH